MAYDGFKDFTRRTAFNKVSHDKTFEIYSHYICSEYQRRPSSIVYKAFDEKFKGGDTAIKGRSKPYRKLAGELGATLDDM